MMRTEKLGEALLLMSIVFFTGCGTPGRKSDPAILDLRERIRNEFALTLSTPPVPYNNPQSPDKVTLGEALFFDPNLSSCGTVACASCHRPEQGFSDGKRVSLGCSELTGRRNSNTIYNAAYLSHLFWDGRVQSLEEQALAPVVDPAEMANSWDNVIHYLSTGEHPTTGAHFPESARFYRHFFETVFSGEITSTNTAKALAAYQRTVVTRDSAFDRWLLGDDAALTPPQKKGALVFFGRGRCSECHHPPDFTDSDFHNIGVPTTRLQGFSLFPENERICEGIPADVDPGRAGTAFLQSSCADLGKFKTPGLRNVELSPPYMHNGAFSTLEDVLQHYWRVGRGSATAAIGTLDKKVTSVMLTDFGGHPDDITNLVAFLKGLTGSQVEGPGRGIAPPE